MDGMTRYLAVILALFSALWIFPAHSYSDDAIDLTIPDIITTVLSNNLKLKRERISPYIRQEAVKTAESVFDPIISAGGSASVSRTEGTPSDRETLENSLSTGVGKKLSSGANVSVNISISDDSVKNPGGSDYDGASLLTTLVITQPLLKNKGVLVNRRDVILAEHQYDISELSLKQAVIETIAEAEKRYWQLYSAIENLKVHEKSLLLARQFLSEVEERVRIGIAAPLDSLQAKAEVAFREEGVIVAENIRMNNQDYLLNYIYGGLIKTGNARCLQEPEFDEIRISEEELIRRALNARTDYLAVRYQIASAETDAAYMKNQKKPQLDLIGTLGYNIADSDDPALSTAHKDYYSGALAVSLKFPWGFRKDDANYRTAILSLKQAQIRSEEIESDIRLEIRTNLRTIASTHKRYLAARAAMQLAEEKLVVEEEKYKNGLSTGYNVLLYQRDLTDAMVISVNAVIEYQLAMIALNKSAGITLEQHNIQIQNFAGKIEK
jgi:outer membrane protein TolC